MDYKIVYEVINDGMKTDWLTSFFFFLVGIVVVVFNSLFNKGEYLKENKAMTMGWLSIFFGLILTVVIAPSQIKGYYKIKEIYKNGDFNIVEGRIESFDPMPHSGHKYESFSVNGIIFRYSNYGGPGYGFHNAASHGGPLKENGQQVRLSYIESGFDNIILKIELKQ